MKLNKIILSIEKLWPIILSVVAFMASYISLSVKSNAASSEIIKLSEASQNYATRIVVLEESLKSIKEGQNEIAKDVKELLKRRS